jgi:predicted nucleotidyltransferase
MGGATRAFYLEVLEDCLRILRDAGADHLVIGSAAVRSLLGRPLDHSEDVDVFIRERDAERLLGVFAREGYATHRRDERWIYKVARPDVTFDLIFEQSEFIPLDDEHLRRADRLDVEGISLPVPSAEDLAVMRAAFDGDERRGRWYDALALFRSFDIDWDYVVDRGAAHAPRRVLAALLYATDAGVDVPKEALARLAKDALPP